MTRYTIILLVIFLIACGDDNASKFRHPRITAINEIIDAVIYQDSLPVVKFSREAKDLIPLSVELRKVQIIVPDTTLKIPPAPVNDVVSIFKLVGYKGDKEGFFPKSDYDYLLYQNDSTIKFSIDKKLLTKLVTVSYLDEHRKEKAVKSINYYDLSVPIISKDSKKAYVEVTYNCSGLCGGARGLFLKKVNDKWIVVARIRLWIS